MAFPMGPNNPVLDALRDAFREFFEHRYDDVVVYADRDSETVLYEGPIRMRGDGWLELPSGRLVSPDAVHHIDVRSE